MHLAKITFGIATFAALIGVCALTPRASFSASPPVGPTTDSEFIGDWRGTIEVGQTSFRIVFRIGKSGEGSLMATLDSPDNVPLLERLLDVAGREGSTSLVDGSREDRLGEREPGARGPAGASVDLRPHSPAEPRSS